MCKKTHFSEPSIKKRESTGESIPVQARPIGVDKAAGRAGAEDRWDSGDTEEKP